MTIYVYIRVFSNLSAVAVGPTNKVVIIRLKNKYIGFAPIVFR
jgi:hypothetical protein